MCSDSKDLTLTSGAVGKVANGLFALWVAEERIMW